MTSQDAQIQGSPSHKAASIVQNFYDLHPRDPMIMSLDQALNNDNKPAVKDIIDKIFDRLPTNPVRANKLYKILSTEDQQTAHELLSRYQAKKYKIKLENDIKDRIALLTAQMELDEAEILGIRNKVSKNLEPALKASEERIKVLEEKIEQQRAIVDTIQSKVDAVAERLANTKTSLQEAILEQTRLDKEIALLLEDDDEDEEEEEEGRSGKGDKDRLKQQKSGQQRIAELMQEEINHLTLNQKAADRELENAKAKLTTLEQQLSEELSTHADLESQIEEQKRLISELEAQNKSNLEEITKLTVDQEFIQSATFANAFNNLAGDVPMPEIKEQELTRLIEQNAKSETLLSAIDDAHYTFLSEQEQQNMQEQEKTASLSANILDDSILQQENSDIQIDGEGATNTEGQESEQAEDLNFDRDLALESATDHAVRMAMTLEADNTVNMDDFDSLMDTLPEELRNKVEPEVTARLEQKGINIVKDLGATEISKATPQIFDRNSLGPKSEIKSASPGLHKAADLRTAFADSQAFKKYNAPGVDASYDTKPIKGVDPTIFQKGLNNSSFEPAQQATQTQPTQTTQQPKPETAPQQKIDSPTPPTQFGA